MENWRWSFGCRCYPVVFLRRPRRPANHTCGEPEVILLGTAHDLHFKAESCPTATTWGTSLTRRGDQGSSRRDHRARTIRTGPDGYGWPRCQPRAKAHPRPLLKGILWCTLCHQQGREFRLIRQRSKGRGGVYEYFFLPGKAGTCLHVAAHLGRGDRGSGRRVLLPTTTASGIRRCSPRADCRPG